MRALLESASYPTLSALAVPAFPIVNTPASNAKIYADSFATVLYANTTRDRGAFLDPLTQGLVAIRS